MAARRVRVWLTKLGLEPEDQVEKAVSVRKPAPPLMFHFVQRKGLKTGARPFQMMCHH